MEEDRRYVYPAVFKKHEDGTYTASFVDFDGYIFVEADNLVDILDRAGWLLSLMTHMHEKVGYDFPKPTPLEEIDTESNEFASYVLADINSF